MPYGMNLALVLLLSIAIVSMFSVFVALRSFPKASAKLRGFFLPTKYFRKNFMLKNIYKIYISLSVGKLHDVQFYAEKHIFSALLYRQVPNTHQSLPV